MDKLPVVVGREEDDVPWRVAQIRENFFAFLELAQIRDEFLETNPECIIPKSLAAFCHLACPPLDPEVVLRTPKRTLLHLASELHSLYTLPESEVVSESQPPPGSVLKLLSSCGGNHLVRRNGDRVDLNRATFRRKHVLVFCLRVPVLYGPETDVQSLFNLCRELHATRKDKHDFEMVMVARMRSQLVDTKAVFDHFFSAFPESCLAVPYEDSRRRDHICNLLGLHPHPAHIQGYFFGVCGRNPLSLAHILTEYGAEAFPFNTEMLHTVCDLQDSELKGRLEDFLRPKYDDDDHDVVVYKFGRKDEVCALSKLTENKHVGLYLCQNGLLIPNLSKNYKQYWRKPGREFVIVVMYCPPVDGLAEDPEIFREKMDRLLVESNVVDWWCLPYNNSVRIRFREHRNRYSCDWRPFDCMEDKLIIVGTDGKILDMYGDVVMRNHHPELDVYPFTREANIQQMVKLHKQVELKSVLELGGGLNYFRGNDRSDVISAEELARNKKILFYVDSYINFEYRPLNKLVEMYGEMKKIERSGFEVVFFDVFRVDKGVDRGYEVTCDHLVEKETLESMPWYVCPCHATFSEAMIKFRELLQHRSSLVGFVGGQICSLTTTCSSDWPRICFDETLHQDIEFLLGYDDSSRFKPF